MSIPNYAYCEPLPLDGYIFGGNFDLEWTGSQFTAKWSNFTLPNQRQVQRYRELRYHLAGRTPTPKSK
jgi:hypothetical protein